MTARTAVAPDDAYNRALVEHVHPPGWTSPTPAERHDLVVLGGGTAGLVSAMGAAGLGARVALVERHLLGGDCLNTGCVPSKVLIAAARAVADARRVGALGVAADVRVDFGAVMERLRRVRAEMAPHDGARRPTVEAGRQGLLTLTVPLHDVDRALLEGDTRGFARMHVHPGTGRILGATLVGKNAGDTIGPAVLAMTTGVRAAGLARSIAPYPTRGEVWKRLGDAWMRTRLTDRVRRLVGLWLRWMR